MYVFIGRGARCHQDFRGCLGKRHGRRDQERVIPRLPRVLTRAFLNLVASNLTYCRLRDIESVVKRVPAAVETKSGFAIPTILSWNTTDSAPLFMRGGHPSFVACWGSCCYTGHTLHAEQSVPKITMDASRDQEPVTSLIFFIALALGDNGSKSLHRTMSPPREQWKSSEWGYVSLIVLTSRLDILATSSANASAADTQAPLNRKSPLGFESAKTFVTVAGETN